MTNTKPIEGTPEWWLEHGRHILAAQKKLIRERQKRGIPLEQSGMKSVKEIMQKVPRRKAA